MNIPECNHGEGFGCIFCKKASLERELARVKAQREIDKLERELENARNK